MDKQRRRAPPGEGTTDPSEEILCVVRDLFEEKCMNYLLARGATPDQAERAWKKTLEDFWEIPPRNWQYPENLNRWFYRSVWHNFLDIRK